MTRLNTGGQVWKAIALTGIALAVAGVMGTIVFGAQARSATQTGSPPTTTSYQGHLLDSSGEPVDDGTYAITFTLWNSATLGTRLWGPEAHSNVQVTDGYFAVRLGMTETLRASLLEAHSYLEIEVEGETLAPRQQFGAVPFALTAERVRGVEDAQAYMINGPLGSGAARTLGPVGATGGAAEVASMPFNHVGTSTGNPDLGHLANRTAYYEFDGSEVLRWSDSVYNELGYGFAVMAWLRFDDPGSGGNMYLSKYVSTGDWAWYLNLNSGRPQFATRDQTPATRVLQASTVTLSADTWYFVAAWYRQATGMELHVGDVDGNFYTWSDPTAQGNLYNSSANYTLGGFHTSGQFAGDMLVPVPLLGNVGLIDAAWIENYYRRTLVLVQ